MKFWLTCVFGILIFSGVMTAVYVWNPSNIKEPKAPDEGIGPLTSAAEKIPDNAPKAKVESTFAEFLNVGQFEEGKHTFTITNVGGLPLTLNPGKPSCTCTSAALDPISGVILPNQTAKYTLSYNTKERNGKLGVSAPLNTNDPLKRTIDFRIHLDIKPELIVTKPEVFFGRIQEEKVTEETLQIYSTLHSTAKIELKESSSKSIQYEIRPLTDAQKKELNAKSGAEVVCRFNGKMPVGGFVETAVFSTGLPKTKTYTITMAGNVSGKIQLVPEYLSFVAVPFKGEKSQKLAISAAGLGDADELKVGEVSPKFLHTRIVRDPKLKVLWRLEVTVPKEDKEKQPGDYSGIIPIIDKNGVRRISIPISVTVQSDDENQGAQ